jgi:hypothetical protein
MRHWSGEAFLLSQWQIEDILKLAESGNKFLKGGYNGEFNYLIEKIKDQISEMNKEHGKTWPKNPMDIYTSKEEVYKVLIMQRMGTMDATTLVLTRQDTQDLLHLMKWGSAELAGDGLAKHYKGLVATIEGWRNYWDEESEGDTW